MLSAAVIWLQGWRLPKMSQWLQQSMQQQLAAKFGASLTYDNFKTRFAGINLQGVTYLDPDSAFTVRVDEIKVRFHLWDLLWNALRRDHSNQAVSTGAPPDSLSQRPAANYHFDISLDNPCITFWGDWRSRIRSWMQSRQSSSSRDSSAQRQLNLLTSSLSSANQANGSQSTPSVAINPPSWDFQFVKNLEVKNGKIVWASQAGETEFLLADEVSGGLHPFKKMKGVKTKPRQAEMNLSGRLLASEQLDLYVLLDEASGQIDSLSLGLNDAALQQLEKLWEGLGGGTTADQARFGDKSDSTQKSFQGGWKIAGGVINGNISLKRLPSERQVVASSSPSSLVSSNQSQLTASIHEEILGKRSDGDASIPAFQVTGYLFLNEGQVKFDGRMPITVESINCDAEIYDGKLHILRGTQRVNQQSMRLSGTVNFAESPAAAFQPNLDLVLDSDSLNLAAFLLPLVRNEKDARTQLPIHGQTTFRGRITGSPSAPRIEAAIYASSLEIYSQPVQHLFTHLSYAPRRSDGAVDSTLQLIECSGKLEGLRWKGWGEINLLRDERPLRMNLTAEGELTSSFKKLLSFDLLRCDAKIEAQISGPLADPKTVGQFTLRVLEDQLSAAAQPGTQPMAKARFEGNFTSAHDTLRIEARTGAPSETSRAKQNTDRQLTSRSDANKPPAIELSAEVWNFFRLSAGRKGTRATLDHPLFKIQGKGIQSLPAIFGKDISGTLSSNFKLDAYLQGRADSLNIRVDGRHKIYGHTLFQIFGYLWPKGRDQRMISGDIKIFPGAHNEMDLTYSAVWQDSIFYVTDLRAGDWLVGAFEVETHGNRTISGGVKFTRAELSRLLESVAREVPQYSGNLFGEIRLSGSLDFPRAEGDFWLFDASFNGIGNFVIGGKARMDATGWEITDVDVRRNDQPYLQGSCGYQFATREPHFEAHARDIDAADFLRAVANLTANVFTGRASFDLKTTGAFRAADGRTYLPLNGFINVQNGRIVWFVFDELAIDLNVAMPRGFAAAQIASFVQPPSSEGRGRDMSRRSYLRKDGAFLSHVRYIKKNAFMLDGAAYLPFNLQDALHLSLSGDGNFLAVLPDFTSFFQQTASDGHLDLNLVGPYKDLTMRNTHLRLQNGALKMSKVAPEAHEITGEAFVDSRGTFIEIFKLEGKVGDTPVQLRNQESPPPFFAHAPRLAKTNRDDDSLRVYQPLRLGGSRLHLGTILVKSGGNGLLVNIPGLMERGETGRFVVAGRETDEFMITGPWAHPLFYGRLVMQDVDFMFPFDETAEPADPLIRKILFNIDWDVVVQSRKDNRYMQRVPTALDNVYVNFGIDDATSELKFTGILQDSTLQIEGTVTSTHGTVEYLDLNFRVEKFGADFDKSDWRPIVYGRAWTVITDSTNFPHNVYLTLKTVDPNTREEFDLGRFQNAYFKLTSDYPNILGNTQEQILAELGYSVENVGAKATQAVGISTDNLFFRPLIRPVERELERRLGLDMVRLSSRFTRNFLVANFGSSRTSRADSLLFAETNRGHLALKMLQSMRLSLGKYLWHDLYVNYIGQIEVWPNSDPEETLEDRPNLGLGFRHILGLEYRINPAMFLQFEYDYNPLFLSNKDDRKLWLRHSFPVEFTGKAQ